MGNHDEEQKDEVEALESIYPDSFTCQFYTFIKVANAAARFAYY